jgi:hypothetical protein
VKHEGSRTRGPWQDRVRFAADGSGVAYRPGEVLVRAVDEQRAQRALRRDAGEQTGAFLRFTVDEDPLVAVQELALAGVVAQPNHVLLPHCTCCGPHPSALWANPFQANPFQANPFQANPFQANPFQANPFQANPFQANPFQANPRQLADLRATGRRDHSARPAEAPDLPAYPHDVTARSAPSIVVVDTGTAAGSLRPHVLHGLAEDPAHAELPDEDGDACLDPVAGHGTFIAGLVEQIVPGCALTVHGLIGGYGDTDEVAVCDVLDTLAQDAPDLVNLSFGGYAVAEMARLAQAVRGLQAAGSTVVASAGNDATCRPSYPAALPGVVSVGALGPAGPAPFTNYGPWVRACAPGVDVVSSFFTSWDPDDPQAQAYREWVSWSGTSFAAPAVVAALAACMRDGLTGAQAVHHLVDAPGLFRWPGLGTVVNTVPCWRIG